MAPPVLIGAAALNPDTLVDSLVADVIDGLREELHPQFGVRAYRCYRVIRTWAGAVVGEGSGDPLVPDFVDAAAELRPQPLVTVWDGLRYVQAVCGIEELGEIKLTEISLTYTEAQLLGQPLGENQELFIALADAHGQGSSLHYFRHARPPYVDRIKDMGWVVVLRRVQTGSPWEPTP